MDASIGSFSYPLIVALLGSLHCMGMCGGFVLLASKDNNSETNYFLYQTGKTGGYLLLATVVFLLAAMINKVDTVRVAQYALTTIAGISMAYLAVVGLFKLRYPGASWQVPSSWLQNVTGKPVLFGFLNGLMPCGLVYMFLVAIPLAGSWPEVVMMTVLFGLGTYPSLWIIRKGLTVLSKAGLRVMEVSLYVYLLVFAIYTILRGNPVTQKLVHGMFPHSIESFFRF